MTYTDRRMEATLPDRGRLLHSHLLTPHVVQHCYSSGLRRFTLLHGQHTATTAN